MSPFLYFDIKMQIRFKRSLPNKFIVYFILFTSFNLIDAQLFFRYKYQFEYFILDRDNEIKIFDENIYPGYKKC